MAKFPRKPPAVSNETVLDEIEDLLLEHVGDADIADELAHDIGQILDQWGWNDG